MMSRVVYLKRFLFEPNMRVFLQCSVMIKDNLVSLVTYSMAKFISWIVEDSGELTKACPKYAVNKVFQNDGRQSCLAETLHQG